jgi:hypothetical protein
MKNVKDMSWNEMDAWEDVTKKAISARKKDGLSIKRDEALLKEINVETIRRLKQDGHI